MADRSDILRVLGSPIVSQIKVDGVYHGPNSTQDADLEDGALDGVINLGTQDYKS